MNVLDSKINWYKFKTSPYKHQLDALERSWEKNTLPILWKWVLVNLKC